MNKKLMLNGLIKLLSGLLMLVLLLFLPAGTFEYFNAWLLIAILFGPMLLLGVFLLFKAPELLKKRLNSRESEGEQKRIILLSSLVFIAGFLLAGFDFRFGWSQMPRWLTYIGAALFLLCYALYAEVMRENAYLSRTVEIQEGQYVVDTGLYGIVRHPMYVAALLLFLSMPIVLGSYWALLLFALFNIPIFVLRILNEEKVLETGLPGYAEYKKKVKYRLIPFIW